LAPEFFLSNNIPLVVQSLHLVLNLIRMFIAIAARFELFVSVLGQLQCNQL
jgi:hypothetical protein